MIIFLWMNPPIQEATLLRSRMSSITAIEQVAGDNKKTVTTEFEIILAQFYVYKKQLIQLLIYLLLMYLLYKIINI